MVQTLKCPAHIQVPTQANFLREDHHKGWKRIDDKPAPGPLGLHVIHWKVGLEDPYIMEFDYLISSYPYQPGYSLDRWRLGLDLINPNKSNNNFVLDAREMLLLKLDVNMNQKHS